MTDLSFTLPSSLQDRLEQRVAQGGYADAGDYLRDLIRRDLADVDEDAAWVREKVAEGLASGIVDKHPSDVIDDIIAARHARRG